MTVSDITPEMMSVIENWCEKGAAYSIRAKLDRIEDAVLAEVFDQFSAEEKLALIRELRTLRREFNVFTFYTKKEDEK